MSKGPRALKALPVLQDPLDQKERRVLRDLPARPDPLAPLGLQDRRVLQVL